MSFLSGFSAALGLSREKSALSNGQMFKHFKATYAAATCDVSVDDCEQVRMPVILVVAVYSEQRVAGMAVSQRRSQG
jgi:hypothetical protein